MNLLKKIIIIQILFAACISYASAQKIESKVWNFDNLNGWEYGHQDNNPDNQISIENGYMQIFTRHNSRDRKKIRTEDKIYTTGRYTWRVYISDMGQGDQASIGAWIYNDDEHEIDFEIGYGNKEVRVALNAGEDDLVAYMTTQANPFSSIPVLIKKGWHIFEIDLSLVDGNYLVKWIIDGRTEAEVQQTFGTEYPFFIFCSVENLIFLGDHIPAKFTYALYDYVKYVYHK